MGAPERLYESECLRLCWSRLREMLGWGRLRMLWRLKRFPVIGAYELALKCSHLFNLLDARGCNLA